MTTCPGYGVSCHTTLYRVKSDMQSQSNINISLITDSVRCVGGVRCQAITQVKQLFAGSVLGWATAGPRPAHRNAEWEVIFQTVLDCEQTLLNGRLYRHRFFAVSLCPRANAIKHRREWLRSYSHGG